MAMYRYGNLTIPYEMLQALFCKRFSAQEIYSVLNITCPNHQQATSSNPIVTDTINETETTSWDNSRKLLVVATAVIFLVGIVFNLGLLSFLYRQKKLFKASRCYVFNLAMTDVLVLLNMLAFMVIINLPVSVMSSRLQMFMFPSLDMFVSSASMLSVAAVAFDRVVKLSFSQSTYNGRRSTLMKYILLAIWLYCFSLFGLSVARVFQKTSHDYNMFVFWLATTVAFVGALLVTGISCVVIVALYIKQQYLGEKTISNSSVESLISVHQLNNDGKKINKSRQALKGLLLIMACLPFLMGWSFYLSIQTYEVVNNTYLDSAALNMAMLLVPWIISAMNPLIIVLTQKSLRHEVARSIRGMIKKTGGATNGALNDSKQLTIV